MKIMPCYKMLAKAATNSGFTVSTECGIIMHNPLSSGHWNGDSFETMFALHHNSLMLQNAVLRSHSFIKLSFLCEMSCATTCFYYVKSPPQKALTKCIAENACIRTPRKAAPTECYSQPQILA